MLLRVILVKQEIPQQLKTISQFLIGEFICQCI